jgi:rhodanese-related sulfurtransferase
MLASTKSKSFAIYLGWLIRFLVSAIFILSALAKVIDRAPSVLSLGQLFALPYAIAEIAVILWSIVEAGLVVLVWSPKLSRIIVAVPLALLVIMVFSYWRGIDCGCFGSLPFLSQFSFGAHLLLLAGMSLGLYYLTTTSKAEKATPQTKDGQTATISETPSWTGLAAVVMMFSAFLALPFTSSDSRTSQHPSNDTVDRTVVEAAIANHSAVIIDARPEFQYELGHLPSAINIPYNSDSLVAFIEKHSLKNQALIIYCSSAHCNAAEVLVEKLRELGCKKVSIYPGGWEDWVSGRVGDGVK